MILVNKYWITFIKVTIQQYLLMGKQVQESLIQFKDMKKKDYFKCAWKTFSNEEKFKMIKMVSQHL